MARIILHATIFALNIGAALPGYCQADGNAQDPYGHLKAPATPEQLRLNQQLTAPQEPLKILEQHQGVSNSSLGRMIDDMKGMVKDMVKIDVPNSGDPHVHVKAPFVNVDLEHGQPDVRVNAPFVHVTKSGGRPVSVQAPFTKIGDNDPTVPGTGLSSPNNNHVRIKAPFVNVDNTNAGSHVKVNAPFTKVESDPLRGTQVQAPFTNIGGEAIAPPATTQTPSSPTGTNPP